MMSNASLHITLAQINPIVGNIEYNLNKIRKIRDDAPATTNLIIFPELALCGYPPEDLVLKPFFLARVPRRMVLKPNPRAGNHIVPAPEK